MPEPRKLRVFLCHSSQDKPIVRELYQRLLAEGWIDPWLDEENILPGQEWNLEIEKAVEASDVVIVCISRSSVSKEGYVQREIKKVLDIASEKPEGTIFIIPLRLDEYDLPRSMRMYQYLDYFPESELESSLRRLLRALKTRAESLQRNIKVKIETTSKFGDAEKGLGATPPSHPLHQPHSGSTGEYSILFLAADPTDATRLRLGEELREIQEKLQLSKQRDRFKLEQRMSVRPADISQALLDVQPQIVHFSGHGMASGELCFEDSSGRLLPIRPDALAALFEQFSSQVNCVILNACFSEKQAEAIRSHIDYVIGMNKAVGDRAAIAFAIGFYQALGAGRSIEEAYKLGCVQIQLHGIEEHLTPVLLKRAGT